MRKTRKINARYIYRLLKRNTHKNHIHGIKREFKGPSHCVLQNSHPFPTIREVESHALYIPGGIRVGARYPDIIITKDDFDRAHRFLDSFSLATTEDISHKVYDLFKIKDIVYRNINLPQILPWGLSNKFTPTPFYKAEQCFNKKIFNCDEAETCAASRKIKPESLTSIMALPYIFGDCREIAWFTGFLCHVLNQDKNVSYRICYSTLYSSKNGGEKSRIMDHVFVVECKHGKYKVIDPFTMKYFPNSFIMHTMELKIRDSDTPVFTCGKIFVNSAETGQLIVIPKIYDGSMHWTHLDRCTKDSVLLWNNPVPYTMEKTWLLHKEWC
jgi:hypothetical protein